MPFERDITVSMRENIAEYYRVLFDEQDVVPPYTTEFFRIERAAIPEAEKINGPTLAIYDHSERKEPEIGSDRVKLTLTFEFSYPMKEGDKASTELNRILLDVQRLVRSDIYCGGLTLNVVEIGSDFDIEGTGDSIVGGIVQFEVLYRHKILDPSKKRGE